MPTIDLKLQDWNEVCRILQTHAKDYSVWAFGSRVKGKAKTYSDLDLVIMTRQPLSLSKMAIFKEAFDESDLTIRVDIVDWAATNVAFQKIIEQDKVLIQEGRSVMNTSHNFKSQSGAILAFCLVMLLLLTLSGTRMIQQNKQQLEIANSVRLLTQEFANTEAVVADAKTTVNKVGDNGAAHDNYYDDSYFPADAKLLIRHPAHQCKPTA
jgi:predicted nucleotidyltransferase